MNCLIHVSGLGRKEAKKTYPSLAGSLWYHEFREVCVWSFTPRSSEPTFDGEFNISLNTLGRQVEPNGTQAPITAVLPRSEANADHDGTVFSNGSSFCCIEI